MKIIIALCAILSINFAIASQLTGKVVKVADGDTLTLLTENNKQVKIRLAEIDAPEKAQPFGNESKKALIRMAANKNAVVKVQTTDRYGRKVGHVYIDDLWVNASLVRDGYAWVYRQYSNDRELLDLERMAKLARKGLWTLQKSEIVPPWEWRKNGKKSSQKAKPVKLASTSSNYSCGSKKYCSHMSSCEEATFYLEKCGLTRLDRDKDGVPCESLCK